MNAVLAYDLGTGGLKTALYDLHGSLIAFKYVEIQSFYPHDGYFEQKPADWLDALVESTSELLKEFKGTVLGISVSGHSMAAVPVLKDGSADASVSVPIWCDTRAKAQTEAFFRKVDKDYWYDITGSGLDPWLYTVFKIMWIKDNDPELYEAASKFIGTKDYLNYMLTGAAVTDKTYASSTGIYDIRNHTYKDEFIDAAGLSADKFPEIKDSFGAVGYTSGDVCKMAGIPSGIPVFAGGVDNTCTTIGARCVREGDTYISLGSSAQFVTLTKEPQIDPENSSFVWDFGLDGLFVSSFGTLAACTALRWVMGTFFKYLDGDYAKFDMLAGLAAPGSGGVIFIPDMVEGRCSFTGISAKTTQEEIARSVLEGICMSILLASGGRRPEKVLVAGGGAKSDIWMQIFADIFGSVIITRSNSQGTAGAGAAYIALKGLGINKGYEPESKEFNEKYFTPDAERHAAYKNVFEQYRKIRGELL